ncbi:MAG TPA: hypothetical protein VLJ37_00405 [bacterium]|nr:hypothetical protein [bacterium]
MPRIEIDRPLVSGGEIVRDPFAVDPLTSSGGDSALARFGEGTLPPDIPPVIDGANPMPGVLNPPDVSALVPDAAFPSAAPARGFLARAWEGFLGFFGRTRSASGLGEGAMTFYTPADDATPDPAAARRAIVVDARTEEGAPGWVELCLNDPNPFTRVRIKLEMDMPGSESLESFLGRVDSMVPEARRAEVRSILSLLTDRSAGSGTLVMQLRWEVAAEIHASGEGYRNRYQLTDAVRTVLARYGLDVSTLEAGMSPGDRASLSAVLQNLSLQLIPDDVPVFRTSGRGVREGATTTVMKANLDGMTYWGVGTDGIAVAENYATEGRVVVTTTVGELRRLGVLTTDDIAIVGNAVELYHDPREDGGWVRIPVRVVNRSPGH